jgi:hypothetical protein
VGTRNVTAVFVDGKYKLAQYGQWDGYPEGQGATALKFCHDMQNAKGWPDFKKHLELVRFVEKPEIEKMYAECGHDGSDLVKEDVHQKFHKRWPYFTRDHGAKILELVSVADSEVLTTNQIDFCGESLMCEWAYVIDLDKGTFEVFEGLNTAPLAEGERFATAPTSDHKFKDKNGQEYTYKGVKLAATYRLDDLPTEEDFIRRFEEEDDE